MKRRSRTVSKLKKVGATVCLMIVVAILINGFYGLFQLGYVNDRLVTTYIGNGVLRLGWTHHQDAPPRFGLPTGFHGFELDKKERGYDFVHLPRLESDSMGLTWVIPGWVPLIVVLIPTLVLWRVDRRSSKHDHDLPDSPDVPR